MAPHRPHPDTHTIKHTHTVIGQPRHTYRTHRRIAHTDTQTHRPPHRPSCPYIPESMYCEIVWMQHLHYRIPLPYSVVNKSTTTLPHTFEHWHSAGHTSTLPSLTHFKDHSRHNDIDSEARASQLAVAWTVKGSSVPARNGLITLLTFWPEYTRRPVHSGQNFGKVSACF